MCNILTILYNDYLVNDPEYDDKQGNSCDNNEVNRQNYKEYITISFCKLPQRIGENVVILNPLTVGSPAVEATIPGRVGSTSPTITIGMWMYFK